MPFFPRLANAADYPTFARLFPELAVPEPTPTLDTFETRLLPRVVILQDDAGDVLGYSAWNFIGETCHVANVVTAPEARRRGAGRALLEDIRARARVARCTHWYLNVKQENTVAIRLYERCGFTIAGEGWAFGASWAALGSLPPPSRDARVFTPSADDDAEIAARLNVSPALIARLRAREGIVLFALEDEGPVGFAAFDPAFPGVFPIRVARPDLARPLFDAIRPIAKHDHGQVFVEGDRALADALQAIGAKLHFALFRMTGTL